MLIKEGNQIFYLCNRKKVNLSLLIGQGCAEILYGFDLKYHGIGDYYVELCFSVQPPQSVDRKRKEKNI